MDCKVIEILKELIIPPVGFDEEKPSQEIASLIDHRDVLSSHPTEYICFIFALLPMMELPSSTKVRILTASIESKHRSFAACLLKSPQFTLPDVLKTVKLIDSRRQIRVLENKIASMRKRKRTAILKTHLHNLNKEVANASLTPANVKLFRNWVAQITPDNLLSYILMFPPDPWKELVNLLHLRPDNFQLPWFLDFVFTGICPPESMAEFCRAEVENQNQIDRLVCAWNVPYRFLRKKISGFTLQSNHRAIIAKYTDLDTLLWYYDELICPEIDTIIETRLRNGEKPTLAYGKLMERLLYFQTNGSSFVSLLIPLATQQLASCNIALDPPVLVAGDASASMQVAIRTATIISSLITSLSQARLVLYNFQPIPLLFQPTSIAGVLKLTEMIRAHGATAPAAALHNILRQKCFVSFIVIVSDEEENCPYRDTFFVDLLEEYRATINPDVKLVFVSFLVNSEVGDMSTELHAAGQVFWQFRLAKKLPDLSKLDNLLGLLNTQSSFFPIILKCQSLLYKYGHESLCQEQLEKSGFKGKYYPVAMLTRALVSALSITDHSVMKASCQELLTAIRDLATSLRIFSPDCGLVDDVQTCLENLSTTSISSCVDMLRDNMLTWEPKYMNIINSPIPHEAEETPAAVATYTLDQSNFKMTRACLAITLSFFDRTELLALAGVCRAFKDTLDDQMLWHILYGAGLSEKVLSQGESYGLTGLRDIVLTLGSDSSHILCGACLMYAGTTNRTVICYSTRTFAHRGKECITHSGDTVVNGKSVHSISVHLHHLPRDIDSLYFTLCSCGPNDLSGFKNPQILLADQRHPTKNLVSYSLHDASKNKAPSVVMASMCRSSRKSKWTITALGLNSRPKCCGNYNNIRALISDLQEEQMQHIERKEI